MKKGRGHLIVQSKNGTGKTLSFTLLLLSNLKNEANVEIDLDDMKPLQIKGLVVAPTREIAI